MYASNRCGDPEQAAARVARRYARLRALHPPTPKFSAAPAPCAGGVGAFLTPGAPGSNARGSSGPA